MEFPNIVGYAIPMFLLLIAIEFIVSRKKHNGIYSVKDLIGTLKVGTGAGVISILSKAWTVFFFIAVYEFFNPEVEGQRMNFLGYASFGFAWYVWIICQLADDFSYYWVHRANHEIRVLWAAHVVHHSSKKYNLSVGVRNGWFTLFYKPLFYMWMPMIGFHPMMVLVCLGIESLWQFQLHSQYVPRLGFFERFMNTHKHHHVHHSSDIEYLDKNHGGYLNIFDKMFGTFKDLDDHKHVNFGVLHPPGSHKVQDILFHEYKHIWEDVRTAPGIYNKFMYIFGPPGWSHDGSRKTVRQLQEEIKAEREANMASEAIAA